MKVSQAVPLPSGPAADEGKTPQIFAAILGAFLGLAFLKFGNPPIMAKFETPPSNIYEFLMGYPWPSGWAYGGLILLAIAGLWLARPEAHRPHWLVFLPAVWFGCQFLSSIFTIDYSLSQNVLKHFASCTACFYLGYFCLSRAHTLGTFFMFLAAALSVVCVVGWDQHFGGLEATRKYFYLYIYPQLKEIPPEYIKKMSSNRIFGTLFYPNTLAGAILLVLPVSVALIWSAKDRLTAGARLLLISIIGTGAIAALVWSGSKGGWLLALLLAIVALLQQPLPRKWRASIVAVIVVVGLTAFFVRYAGFFQKGATSVSARMDYWSAAVQIAAQHPLVGTGPGTFSKPYADLKKPESEMARLVHNDYLEQASDSGLPAAGLYATFIIGGLIRCFKRGIRGDPVAFAAWLGLLGWGLQGLMEFGLYVPALAWTCFTLLGWLLARARIPLDKAAPQI
jgi:O-antigen ligase